MDICLRDILSKRKLLFDGAVGTMLRHDEITIPDLLTLTSPDIVAHLHRQYLMAGADIISTNTFNSIDFHSPLSSEIINKLNFNGARIAKKQAEIFSDQDRPRFVAGSIGPSQFLISSVRSSNLKKHTREMRALRDAARSHADALIDGGADLLLVETTVDFDNLQAIMEGIQSIHLQQSGNFPFIISLTPDPATGRLYSGEKITDLLPVLQSFNPLAVGINCVPAESLQPLFQLIEYHSTLPILLKPNLGLPDASGRYPCSPEIFASALAPYINNPRIQLLGGCCGTTPSHIQALATLLKKVYSPPNL